MTFNDIVTAVQNRLNITSTASATRIGTTVNDRYRRVMSAIGLNMTRRSTVHATVSLGVSTLTFTSAEKIINVVDRATTPYRILREVTIEELRRLQPYVNSFATHYAIISYTANSVTIEFDGNPQTQFDLYADVETTITTLTGTNTPNFPEDFHDILIHGACADEYRKMEKLNLAQDSETLYERRLSDLRFWIAKSSYMDTYQGKTRNRVVASSVSGVGGGTGSVNGAASYTQTGLITFDRSGAGAGSAPFAVAVASNGNVANLDADLVDGEHASSLHALANATGVLDLSTHASGVLDETNGGTGQSTISQGDLLYGSAANTLSKLPKDINTTRYLSNSGASNNPAWAQVDLTTGVSGDLPYANLAQGSALSVLGVTGNATADVASIAAGSDGQVLRRSGTAVGFGAVNLASANAITGSIPVANLANGTFTVVSSSTAVSQNNWAPGLVGNTIVYWSGAGDITITGFAGGVSGQIVVFKNTGTNIATFSHNSASSAAGNKLFNIATSAGTPVAGGGYIAYQYDGTQWQLVAHEQGAWITATYAAGNFTGNGSMTWTVDSGDLLTSKYKLVGRTLTYNFYMNSTSVGGTPSTALRITNGAWGGFTATAAVLAYSLGNDNATGNTVGFMQIGVALSTAIDIFKGSGTSNWSAATNATNVFGNMTFEVN